MDICSNKVDTVRLLENEEHVGKKCKRFSNHITGSSIGLIILRLLGGNMG